jgi:hypothetical protein
MYDGFSSLIRLLLFYSSYCSSAVAYFCILTPWCLFVCWHGQWYNSAAAGKKMLV